MKGLALCAIAIGILLFVATPSLAHENWHGYYAPAHYHHGHLYYAPGPVVVTAAPVYGYAAYPTYGPIVTPYPAFVPAPAVVAPGPYYYGAPAVTFGYRGRGVVVGVGF